MATARISGTSTASRSDANNRVTAATGRRTIAFCGASGRCSGLREARRLATDALDSFYWQLIGELDEQNSGFGWWAGYSDWKTLAMLSDYLIQLVGGASESLLLASLAAKAHSEKVTADTYKHKQAWRQGKIPFPVDAAGRRRESPNQPSLVSFTWDRRLTGSP